MHPFSWFMLHALVPGALIFFCYIEDTPIHEGEEELPASLAEALATWPRCTVQPANEVETAQRNLVVVTAIDAERKFFYALKASVKQAGWTLKVAGIGEPWDSNAGRHKLNLRELRKLEPCTMVMVADGLDTLIQNSTALASQLPPMGKVRISIDEKVYEVRKSRFWNRWSKLAYGFRSRRSRNLNAGVMLGRAGDVARLLEAVKFLCIEQQVASDQWGLNVLRGGAGPAFKRLYQSLVDVDTERLLQTANPRTKWDYSSSPGALVAHGSAHGDLSKLAVGIEIPENWPPLPDYSPAAFDRHRKKIFYENAVRHCHRSLLVCAQMRLMYWFESYKVWSPLLKWCPWGEWSAAEMYGSDATREDLLVD